MTGSFIRQGDKPDIGCGVPIIYLSEALAFWIMSAGAVPLLIPAFPPAGGWRCQLSLSQLVDGLDGLVLQGGADMSPSSYGEEPHCDEWCGDPRRDGYELAIVREFLNQRKPILGVCRGMQVLNVALGGSLYQDIPTFCDQAGYHRDLDRALDFTHRVDFCADGWLQSLYGSEGGNIISIHHQAVRKLGAGLVVEARSAEDGLIEGIRLEGDCYAAGIQWHPELQNPSDRSLLDPGPILEDFCRAARLRRDLGS